jgi:hypothetical protein
MQESDMEADRMRKSQYAHDELCVKEYLAILETIQELVKSAIQYQVPAICKDIDFLREKFPERTTMKSYYLAHDDGLKRLPDLIVRTADRVRQAMQKMYNFSK